MPDGAPVFVIAPNNAVDTGPQTVNSTSAWVPLCRIAGVRGRKLLLEGIVGAGGALAHLKLCRAARFDGDELPIAIDTDFNTATNDIISVNNGSNPPNIHLTAAGGNFQIEINASAEEYEFYAQAASTNTTLQLRGAAYRVGQ